MPDAPPNTKKLTFSVGIPTFNQADFLPETLDSLLNQSRPPDEILVSDHYSTDNTLEVLGEYAALHPGRIRVVQPPPGVNLTGQYNFTLSSLTGDWITIFNSDDIAYPKYCETLLRGATSDPNAVLIRSGWEQIDASGKSLTRNYLLSVPRVEPPPANLTSQQYGPKVNGTAFALRRDAYLQSGPILHSLESLVDWGLFLQVTPYGSFVYEHALLAGYRIGHDGNKFRERLPMWTRDQQRIFGEVMPLAAQRCGMQDLSWISEASRYNYTRYLARASREFDPDPEVREPIVALFQPWANTLEPTGDGPSHAALHAFSAGAVTQTSIPFTRRIKTFFRPVFQRFHTLLRRS